MNPIIKRLKGNYDVIKAIELYIEKANNSLENDFKENGVASPKAAVQFVNEVEDGISDIRELYSYALTSGFSPKKVIESAVYNKLLEQMEVESLEVRYADMFHEKFEKFWNESVIGASAKIDRDIVITEYTKTSEEWMADQSHQLAEWLKTDDENTVSKLLQNCLDNDKTVKDLEILIENSGLRTGSSARRLAVTEAYRCNNYAVNEAILQNPAAVGKVWRHSGNPNGRPNHKELNGIAVKKESPFKLIGADGITYYPMMPHDNCLPAGETVYCGCTIEEKIDKKILKKSPEEKAKIQRNKIKTANAEWEKEFNERNKKASGIDFDRVKIDWVRAKSPEDQIKYFGGSHSGKARKALLDSGIITTDKDLEQLYRRNEQGKRQLKTLTELKNSGIMTISKATIEHATIGVYKAPSKAWPAGRLYAGGHAYSTMAECDNRSIDYTITGEFSNGVVIGNIPSSQLKIKRFDGGQAWFPKEWTDDDILAAGIYVANSSDIILQTDYQKVGIYNGVAVRILFDADGNITTICPDLNQEVIEGVSFNGGN